MHGQSHAMRPPLTHAHRPTSSRELSQGDFLQRGVRTNWDSFVLYGSARRTRALASDVALTRCHQHRSFEHLRTCIHLAFSASHAAANRTSNQAVLARHFWDMSAATFFRVMDSSHMHLHGFTRTESPLWHAAKCKPALDTTRRLKHKTRVSIRVPPGTSPRPNHQKTEAQPFFVRPREARFHVLFFSRVASRSQPSSVWMRCILRQVHSFTSTDSSKDRNAVLASSCSACDLARLPCLSMLSVVLFGVRKDSNSCLSLALC